MRRREMTTHERFSRMFAHKDADRVPIIDSPWGTTIERWRREGMPKDVSFVDFFGLDHVVSIGADNSPRYEEKVLEETDAYTVRFSKWGATLKNWKHAASTPEFIDFTIKDRATWAAAKARMTPTRDRVDWARLKANYADWRKKGYWIEAGFWFGFDVTHAWAVGTERVLTALVEDPEWCADIFNHYLDVQLALFEMVWQEGYRFDSIRWPDDMGYKQNQFFSLRTYRDVLKPVHKRAIDWAHSKGIVAHLHSCGDVNPLIPELLDIGLDALNPLEVKAGMDPIAIKARYGDRLVLHGGINAVLWSDTAAIESEIRRILPVVKQHGGYIFSSDHSIPDAVSLKDFQHIVALAKKEGKY